MADRSKTLSNQTSSVWSRDCFPPLAVRLPRRRRCHQTVDSRAAAGGSGNGPTPDGRAGAAGHAEGVEYLGAVSDADSGRFRAAHCLAIARVD